jgi:hypothetical protein
MLENFTYSGRPVDVCYGPVLTPSLVPESADFLDPLSLQVVTKFPALAMHFKLTSPPTPQSAPLLYNPACSHNCHLVPVEQSLMIAPQSL